MTSPSSCKCGALLMDDSPDGQCPACLLAHGLLDQPEQAALDADSTSYEPGMILGSYRILSLLGRGGMASVYEALDLRLERKVALKVLPSQFLHQPSFARNFEQEAKLVARLEHPHIVPIYESGSDEGVPWMAMRLLAGGDMGSLLKTSPPDAVKAVAILSAIAQALDYAHAQGVVHRDIKPTNILFDREGRPSVADFGLARLLQGQPSVSRSRPIAGTPAYMAPEQALGTGVDGACDVYSLGIMAYQMFVGTVPFTGDTPVAVLMKHVNEPLPKPPAEQLPRAVHSVIKRATAKNPKDRWPTAGAFVEALEEGRRAHGSPLVHTFGDTHHDPWFARRRRTLVAAALLVAAAALSFILLADRSSGDIQSPRIETPSPVIERPSPPRIERLPPATPISTGRDRAADLVEARNEAIGSVIPRGRVSSSESGEPERSTPVPPALGNKRPESESPSATAQGNVNVATAPTTTTGETTDAPSVAPVPVNTESGPPDKPAENHITQPVLARRVMPVYPDLARAAGIQGDVVLAADVGSDGLVKQVEVVRSVHRLLDAAAVNAVRQYVYKPGLRNGVPDTFRVQVTVIFKLNN